MKFRMRKHTSRMGSRSGYLIVSDVELIKAVRRAIAKTCKTEMLQFLKWLYTQCRCALLK